MRIERLSIDITPGEDVNPLLIQSLLGQGHHSPALSPSPTSDGDDAEFCLPPPPPLIPPYPGHAQGYEYSEIGQGRYQPRGYESPRDYQQSVGVEAVTIPSGGWQEHIDLVPPPAPPQEVGPGWWERKASSCSRFAVQLLSSLLRLGFDLPYWAWLVILLCLLIGAGGAVVNNVSTDPPESAAGAAAQDTIAESVLRGAASAGAVNPPSAEALEEAPAVEQAGQLPPLPTPSQLPPPPQLAPPGQQWMPALKD